MSNSNNHKMVLLSALLFSVLLFNGQRVGATGGSGEEKDRRGSAACLVKEPGSGEKSDSKEDCSAFEPLPATTSGPGSSAAPTTAAPTTGAPSSSSAAPSSSSAAPSSSSAAPVGSSSAGPVSSSSAPSSNFTSRCRLKHALISASLELTIIEQIDWLIMVQELENEILANPCGCLSDEDKVVKAGHKIKKHLSKHKSLKKKLHYKSLAHSAWGHWRDFVAVAVDISGEQAPADLELDVNGECKLFAALRNHSQAVGNATLSADIELLIIDIRITLKKSYWSKTQKHAKLHGHFRKFFKNHKEIDEEDFNEKVEIDGKRSLSALREVFKVCYRTTKLSRVISGSSDSDCELLFKMSEQVNNASIEVTQRLQLSQLHDVIKAKFEIEIDIQIRLQYVSEQIWQCLQQSPFVIELIMNIKLRGLAAPVTPASPQADAQCECDDDDNDGFPDLMDVYELSYCSHYCSNGDSCGEVDDQEGTEPTGAPTSSTVAGSTSGSSSGSSAPPSSSSAAPSSSSAPPSSSSAAPSSSPAPPSSSSAAPSTVAPTTAAPTTVGGSTATPVPCPNRVNTIVTTAPPASHAPGKSWLERSIEVVFNSWTTLQEKSAFQSYFNQVKFCINGNAGNECVGQLPGFRVNKIKGYLDAYQKNATTSTNIQYRAHVFAIDIQGGASTGFYGKISDFCGCADN